MDGQSTAMETTISTPELLEALLLSLDMTTVLVSTQRVSRQWLGVIMASPKIQQALFFRPISTPSRPLQSCSSSREDGLFYVEQVRHLHNPLLVKHFGSIFFSHKDRGHLWLCRADAFANQPWWADATNGEIDDAEAAFRRRRFTQSGASWRRMLVSQPPPLALVYLWIDFGDGRQVLSRALIDLSARGLPSFSPSLYQSTSLCPSLTPTLTPSHIGLRMGLLYDLVQHRAGHHTYNSVWFRVVWGHPRPPFMRDEQAHVHRELLRETSTVVEFEHIHDYPVYEREPADLQAWDSAFRCDDFQFVKIEAAEVFRDAF